MSTLIVNNLNALTPGQPVSQLLRADQNRTPAVPCFRVHRNTGQVIAADNYVKVLFNVIDSDTNSYFSTVNSRYTPLIPGWYQFNAGIFLTSTSTVSGCISSIYKNGTEAAWGEVANVSASRGSAQISDLIYMNGTTDYVEAFAYVWQLTAGTHTLNGNPSRTFFSGHLVRSA